MKPKSSNAKSLAKAPAEAVLKDIRRQTRRHFSAEDKIRIVLDGLALVQLRERHREGNCQRAPQHPHGELHGECPVVGCFQIEALGHQLTDTGPRQGLVSKGSGGSRERMGGSRERKGSERLLPREPESSSGYPDGGSAGTGEQSNAS